MIHFWVKVKYSLKKYDKIFMNKGEREINRQGKMECKREIERDRE